MSRRDPTSFGQRSLALALALVLPLLPGCALFGTEQETPALEPLPVVADDRAFDPSQAVDDDDDLERPWGTAAPAEQDAFASSDTNDAGGDGVAGAQPAAGARARSAAASRRDQPVAQEAASATAPRRAPGGEHVGAELPEDEHVATPVEVDALRAHRRERLAALARTTGSDADAKARIAANPPPEPLGPSKPTAWTVLDYTLEGALLAVLALVISTGIGLARRAPKTTMAIAVAVLASAALLVTQGE